MTVRITNPTRATFVATLYHEVYCRAGGPCDCENKVHESWDLGPDGSYKKRREVRSVPMSFRLAPGESKNGLHDAILQIPQIQAAMVTKPPQLKVIVVATDPAPKTPAKIAPASPPDGDTSPSDDGEVPPPDGDTDETEPRSRSKKRKKSSSSR